jgi:P-type Cu+ transporter
MTTMSQTTCPVCGMSVDEQTSLSASYDDQTYYFSSAGCRDQFIADPGSYVGNTGS